MQVSIYLSGNLLARGIEAGTSQIAQAGKSGARMGIAEAILHKSAIKRKLSLEFVVPLRVRQQYSGGSLSASLGVVFATLDF
jgi:hypothetical protein